MGSELQWHARYAAAQAELQRRSFRHFVPWAWAALGNDRPLIHSWHIDTIADHLQAVTEGRILDLVINVPPRMTKSTLVSVLWPAWHWLHYPHTRFLCASAVDAVVFRDAVHCHDLVDSPWYQETFRPKWGWNTAQDAKGFYTSTAGGARASRTIGQQIVGADADVLLIDDPLDVRDAVPSRAALTTHVEWHDNRASPRLTEPTSPTVLTQQRLHEADLSGHLIERGADCLVLPAIREEEDHSRTALGFVDPRQPGELLCSRMTTVSLAKKRRELGERGFAAQYQQRPAPAEGAVFKKSWLKFWEASTLPTQWDYQIASWDTTFKEGRSNDFCVGQVWGIKSASCYLLDQVRKRMGYDQALEEIRAQCARWPNLRAVLVEKHATGAAIVLALEREVAGIKGVSHQGDNKDSRAEAVTPRFAAGQVYFPHPAEHAWVERHLLPEVLGFPVARHDDQVDAMTQALIWVGENSVMMPEVYRLGRGASRLPGTEAQRAERAARTDVPLQRMIHTAKAAGLWTNSLVALRLGDPQLADSIRRRVRRLGG